MTKYCFGCGAKKSDHNFYNVQGSTYMNCKETGCVDECGEFYSKEKLQEAKKRVKEMLR